MANRKEELEAKINELHDLFIQGKLSHSQLSELCDLETEYQVIVKKEVEESKQAKLEKSNEMKNRRARGRHGEKAVAQEVGGRRDGGVARKDVIQGMFSYEVKTIKSLPSSIIKLMEQAERLKKKGTVAVGVFRCNHPRQEYFILEKNDWLGLHGKK